MTDLERKSLDLLEATGRNGYLTKMRPIEAARRAFDEIATSSRLIDATKALVAQLGRRSS
jgi:hypothetical protein